MKQLLFCLGVFLILTSCENNEKSLKTSQNQITAKVNQLYALDRSSDRYSLPKDLFSLELEKLLRESEKITDTDTERIKKSDNPTDMPMMLTGYLMTGIQDTNTEFKIKKITVNGDIGEVFTEFYYDNDPNLTLEVIIFLIHNNGWKIENIIYNKSSNSNLKNTLSSFIRYSKNKL